MPGLVRTVDPTVEPLSSNDVYEWLRLNASGGSPASREDDQLITGLIESVRDIVEQRHDLAIMNQTWRLSLDAFPYEDENIPDGHYIGADVPRTQKFIKLPRPPLASVTSITTYDDSDASSVFATTGYYVDTASRPGKVVLRLGQAWPSTLRVANAIEVLYVAGYGAAATSVPAGLRRAMLKHVAWLYEHRGEEQDIAHIPAHIDAGYQPYSNIRFGVGLS